MPATKLSKAAKQELSELKATDSCIMNCLHDHDQVTITGSIGGGEMMGSGSLAGKKVSGSAMGESMGMSVSVVTTPDVLACVNTCVYKAAEDALENGGLFK